MMDITVRALSANDILQVWEWGQDKHPVDRALAMLALACPELTPEQLQSLTLGQRNSRLLSLREKTLGPALKGFAECVQCGTPLEFSIDVGAIRLPEASVQEYSLQVDGLTIRFRPLNSLDMAAIVGLVNIDAARLRLIERCLLEATQAGQLLTAAELPESALAALADALSERERPAGGDALPVDLRRLRSPLVRSIRHRCHFLDRVKCAGRAAFGRGAHTGPGLRLAGGRHPDDE
ncbi:MAG: hypothetical protein P8074_13585 [Anaerolineales bacterium]